MRNNVLIQAALARGWHGYILPLQPARRVSHRSVFFGEAGAGQTIDRCIDGLHFLGRYSRGLPEFAGLIGINLADHQKVSLLQRVDIFLRVRPDRHAIHAERQHPLHRAAIHVVPDLRPGIISIHLRHVIEGEVVFFRGRIAVQRFHERHGKLRRV